MFDAVQSVRVQIHLFNDPQSQSWKFLGELQCWAQATVIQLHLLLFRALKHRYPEKWYGRISTYCLIFRQVSRFQLRASDIICGYVMICVVIVQAPDVHVLLNASNGAVHFIVTIGMWICIFAWICHMAPVIKM